ncbi:MAG: glycoside hydrolase family 140 protein [Prolixibacteraceae bacterium]|nr:glycoside hydrolase family 140 protein [Prolixibacteraceae bacterium]MBN2775349.1 glycoside hydrolase family 140 protein [Prolixibacteraceae bacterium]
MKFNNKFVLLLFVLLTSCVSQNENFCPKLKVSENNHFLMTENGDPFFWLGDTGWLLFKKLSREDAETYLNDRKQKGFNIIQAMVIHDLKNAINFYGDSAVTGMQIDKPLVTAGNSFENQEEYDYWDHVEYLIDLANKKGLYMALVPVWGSNVRAGLVSKTQAVNYSRWLADRFKDKTNVIWLNGGDVLGSDFTDIWNTIGSTIRKVSPDQLITYHPFGRTQSSTWFQNEDWLDFNMFQSGHRRYDQDTSGLCYGEDNYRYLNADYQKTPVKPTLDGEPSYEGIPQGLHDTTQPYWTDSDVRRYAYWSVFAGGCGFTYGHNAIMQFHRENDKDASYGVRATWEEALNAPGASQMKYLKELILSKPYFERVPFQSFVEKIQGEKYDYIAATRGNDYVLLYTYNGRQINLDLSELSFDGIQAFWYDPRTGNYAEAGKYQANEIVDFNPPGEKQDGNDWILILEKLNN